MQPVDQAAALADRAATLLQSLVPAAVRSAQCAMLQWGSSEEALRTLLEFHQDVVSPISSAFAFALPSGKALRLIARHATAVVEPGAGNGLWCALLRHAGMPVCAFDNLPPQRAYCRVGLADALSCVDDHHTSAALLLCWPPLELELDGPNTMAADALAAYRGNTLLYVANPHPHPHPPLSPLTS